ARTLSSVFLLCFFFQAEDGIRDGHVTGVQTCALPIFAFSEGARGAAQRVESHADPATDLGGIGIARRYRLSNRRARRACILGAAEEARDELHPVELLRCELGQAVDPERIRASVLDPADPVAEPQRAEPAL